jgi:hypothetical protein
MTLSICVAADGGYGHDPSADFHPSFRVPTAQRCSAGRFFDLFENARAIEAHTLGRIVDIEAAAAEDFACGRVHDVESGGLQNLHGGVMNGFQCLSTKNFDGREPVPERSIGHLCEGLSRAVPQSSVCASVHLCLLPSDLRSTIPPAVP